MKKLIFSVLTVAFVATSASIVTAQSAAAPQTAQAQETKTKVDPASLPEAVKATLAGDDYKDWQVNNAFEVKGATPYYEIELKKGDARNTVKLDKDGKKI